MARKVRLEYEGAVYHVLNRGNYRNWIFETEGACHAFEKSLFEACEKSEWVLHGYVLMGNHYHLAIETPKANLVDGMTWLQATFAARFNRFRKESGHLFQGRYKAFPVEDGSWLGNLCHYIHLNPRRAGIVGASGLRDYRYSSYWYLWRPRIRPSFFDATAFLDGAGGLKDTLAGRKSYEKYLEWMMEDESARKASGFAEMSRGWALGSKDFKRALVKEHRERLARVDLGEEDVKELRLLHWEDLLERSLNILGKDRATIPHDPKSAPWKIAIAAVLKQKTQASNGWLAEKLNLGAVNGVSYHVARLRDGKIAGRGFYEEIISKFEI